MKIGEIAKKSALSVRTVRYYDEIGLLSPKRQSSGYRLYDEQDLAKLIFIRRARTFAFDIKTCRKLVSLYENPNRASGDVRTIAQKHLQEIITKQVELQKLHDDLFAVITHCQGNQQSHCPIIDLLST